MTGIQSILRVTWGMTYRVQTLTCNIECDACNVVHGLYLDVTRRAMQCSAAQCVIQCEVLQYSTMMCMIIHDMRNLLGWLETRLAQNTLK